MKPVDLLTKHRVESEPEGGLPGSSLPRVRARLRIGIRGRRRRTRMNELLRWNERARRAADVEAETPITAGPRSPETARVVPRNSTGLLALAKLVEIRRRSLGLTLDELSRQASVSQAEILCLEAGVAGPPVEEHLSAIARILHLREGPLLELAADKLDPTGRLREAVETFVARTAHSEKPTSGEAEAVEEFVRVVELA